MHSEGTCIHSRNGLVETQGEYKAPATSNIQLLNAVNHSSRTWSVHEKAIKAYINHEL